MVLSHLIVQSSILCDITPSKLDQVGSTNPGAIVAKQEIILAVPYQRTLFKFKRDYTLHLGVAQLLLRCLYAFVLENKEWVF